MSTTSISSGLQTADTLIFQGKNRINAITLITDGTNPASVLVYDNTSAAGTVIAKVSAAGAQNTVHVVFEKPVKAELGLYADVTGTGAGYIVFYGA